MLHHGDCVEVMRGMEDGSVDAVVCDPPYGLEFMGKDFDKLGDGERQELWHLAWTREAYRVLKPGGHLLAFGGTRTYHRLACAVEDAGFEIRDSIHWVYATGFPKSHDVSKAIDEKFGIERRESRAYVAPDGKRRGSVVSDWAYSGERDGRQARRPDDKTLPATDAAKRWQGWGTALKPAHEPIVLARKPLIGTVAENVLTHGTGALNVDGCRVGTTPEDVEIQRKRTGGVMGDEIENDVYGKGYLRQPAGNPSGRWPPNFVLSHHPDCKQVGVKKVRGDGHFPASRPGGSEVCGPSGHSGQDNLKEAHLTEETVPDMECPPSCPVRALEETSGETSVTGRRSARSRNASVLGTAWATDNHRSTEYPNDTGTAARFFPCFKYQAKASTAERWNYCKKCEVAFPCADPGDHAEHAYLCLDCGVEFSASGRDQHKGHRTESLHEGHPTVKPVDLMRWLVRLVAPPGGVVLDPFVGSGTTAVACALEGVGCVGIERDEHSFEIARARTAWVEERVRRFGRPPAELGAAEAARRWEEEDPRQMDLFGDAEAP